MPMRPGGDALPGVQGLPTEDGLTSTRTHTQTKTNTQTKVSRTAHVQPPRDAPRLHLLGRRGVHSQQRKHPSSLPRAGPDLK